MSRRPRGRDVSRRGNFLRSTNGPLPPALLLGLVETAPKAREETADLQPAPAERSVPAGKLVAHADFQRAEELDVEPAEFTVDLRLAEAIEVLSEPELEFGHGQKAVDPHAGLALFGPYENGPGGTSGISYGVIGTPAGVAAFEQFARRLAGPIVSQTYGAPDEDPKEKLLWPPFPGFKALFGTEWPERPTWSREIDSVALNTAASHNDQYQRAFDVVNLYLAGVRSASQRDNRLGLIVCVVPDLIYENCRPLSKVSEGEGIAISKRERDTRRKQADLFGTYSQEQYDFSVDFRRQLKARVMEFDIPVQLIRESTLMLREPTREERGMTKLSDRAWNLSVGFFYKAGNKPWRLSSARPGVCYVGLAFRRSEADTDPKTACCAAQMFLDSGDGVVFRGEFGPWYSPESKEHHLDADAAQHLLQGVLAAYADQGGAPLSEIFLHSRSSISHEEFEGYTNACPEGVRLIAIRVRREDRGLRLYRHGKWPIMRGTLWQTGARTAYLWASGFKPTILSYDGAEVPAPLRIDIQHGVADIRQVARDILALTKLNYNECKLGDGGPVTVGFSDAVGEILIGNPTIQLRRPAFKFYI